MFDELLPTGLTGAARKLGVEPLEVVRLMVLSDTVTPSFGVTDDHLAKLKALGRIEHDWWQGRALPKDDNAARARVRGALALLLEKSGKGPIRMDNLWRGLEIEQQALIEEALNLLADEEVLVVANDEVGVTVSVGADHQATVQAIAEGKSQPDVLNPLYNG